MGLKIILSFSLMIALVSAQVRPSRYCDKLFPNDPRDDPPHDCHEILGRVDCVDTCTKNLCYPDGMPPDGVGGENQRLCSTIKRRRQGPTDENWGVDPFHCAEATCHPTTCDNCGNHQKCVQICKRFKRDNFLNERDYPNCDDACDSVPGDWKCWQDCSVLDLLKPRCFNYPCSVAFCSGRGKADCSALGILINPQRYDVDNCRTVPCSHCGGHPDCLLECERENDDLEPGIPKMNCEVECDALRGYKCFMRNPS